MNKNSVLPGHIAVIMDGNGRWAKKRNLPRIMGHREGAKSVRAITRACAELGVKYLTLYAFSTENRRRPEKEVKFLFSLLKDYLKKEKNTLIKNNIRFKVIGDIKFFPPDIRGRIRENIKITSKNKGLTLILALNYGARSELARACRRAALDYKKGVLKPKDFDNESILNNYLYTKDIPDPDLLVRTSGEMRVSNFLLWQIAYSEIYVTDTYWPDFRKKNLLAAIADYKKRERRFGNV